MKKHLLPVVIMALALGTAFAAKNTTKSADPVVMTVNGKPIPLSEFEYLYNKNNSQQMQPTTVDEYLNMFITYKLKVADAEAHGIDTTKQFIDEFNRYRDDLARPYMTIQAVEDSLVREIYDHMATQRYVNYIMMFGGRTPEERQEVKMRADSIRGAITSGKATFADMANQFSVDKNDGVMGWNMAPNRYPYAFEKAVYNTPVGEVSQVQEFPFGYFIVRVDSVRPNPGQVHVRHILKLTRGLSESDKAQRKVEIDSIYNLLVNGGDFAELARVNSDDPGSATNGGELPWFGPGEMVPEFEATSFSMTDGAISEPIESAFGYHIIQRLGSRDIAPFGEVENAIRANVTRDERATMPQEAALAAFGKRFKAKIDEKALKAVRKQILAATDSTAMGVLAANKKAIASIGKTKITVADVAKTMNVRPGASVLEIADVFDTSARQALDNAIRETALAQLPTESEDYRNLINEYRDGMLLFEVSNRNVWERSTADAQGLEQYFRNNRSKYATWTKPHYKGYIVFAESDTVMGVVKDVMMSSTESVEETVNAARQRFGKRIKIERVLSGQGDNQIVDFLVFDGATPQKVSKQWPCFFAFGGEIIDQPQEASDVKGAVTADYQQQLEKQWVEQLRKQYPVVVNYSVLDQLKK